MRQGEGASQIQKAERAQGEAVGLGSPPLQAALSSLPPLPSGPFRDSLAPAGPFSPRAPHLPPGLLTLPSA